MKERPQEQNSARDEQHGVRPAEEAKEMDTGREVKQDTQPAVRTEGGVDAVKQWDDQVTYVEEEPWSEAVHAPGQATCQMSEVFRTFPVSLVSLLLVDVQLVLNRSLGLSHFLCLTSMLAGLVSPLLGQSSNYS
jgi:hypothetical protein